MKKWTCFSSCANFEQTNEMHGLDFHKAKRLDCELKIQSLGNPFSPQFAIALNSSLKAKCNHEIFLIFCRNWQKPWEPQQSRTSPQLLPSVRSSWLRSSYHDAHSKPSSICSLGASRETPVVLRGPQQKWHEGKGKENKNCQKSNPKSPIQNPAHHPQHIFQYIINCR